MKKFIVLESSVIPIEDIQGIFKHPTNDFQNPINYWVKFMGDYTQHRITSEDYARLEEELTKEES